MVYIAKIMLCNRRTELPVSEMLDIHIGFEVSERDIITTKERLWERH